MRLNHGLHEVQSVCIIAKVGTILKSHFSALTCKIVLGIKARLHRRFLLRQLNAIFVTLKLQQVSNMFETPAIIGREKLHQLTTATLA